MTNELSSRSSFETLFRQHYASLTGYALRLVRDADLAEDLVQQVFVNLWEKRETIHIEGAVKNYLMRSVHNHCLNHIKHEKVKSEHASETLHTQDEAVGNDPLEAAELQARVDEVIQEMPEQCQRIFILSRREGRKYQEIADELGISIKTVENQMGKALRLMREGLKTHVSSGLRALSIIFWLLVGVKSLSVVMNKT